MAHSADELFDAAPSADELFDKADAVELGHLETPKVVPIDDTPAKEPSVWEKLAAALKPGSSAGATAHGVVNGGTLGFGDEIYGLANAYDAGRDKLLQTIGLQEKPKVLAEPLGLSDLAREAKGQSVRETPEEGPSLGDTYRKSRDEYRADDKQAVQSHPWLHGLGDVGAAMALPLPGPGKLKGAARLASLVGGGLGLGGATALGNGTADVTRGGALEAAKETGVGGVVGGLLGGVGGKAADWIAGKGAAAQQAARDAAQKLAEKAVNSARGALGGEVSSGARTLEVLEKAAADSSLPQKVQQDAAAFLTTPEAQALRAQVAQSSVTRGGNQVGRIQDAKDALQDALQGADPSAVDAATRARLSPGAAARAVSSRLKTIAQRFGPAIALSAAGAATGGTKGALLGGLMGSGIGAGLGKPGTIIANAIKDPAVAYNLSHITSPVLSWGSKSAANIGGGLTSDIDEARGQLPSGPAAAGQTLAPYLDELEKEHKLPWQSLSEGKK